MEFENFLGREKAIGRSDLIFPIIYIEIPDLKDERYWRGDPVLHCIGQRQYVDWSDHRFELDTPRIRREIALFARTIVHALKRETNDRLGEESGSKEAGWKRPRPAERITHELEARGLHEEAGSRTQGRDRDYALTRAVAEETSHTEVSAAEHRAAKQARAGDERLASKLEAQHAPEQTDRARVTRLFIGAIATILVAIVGLSYALLGRGEDQSVTRSKGGPQDNREPKAIYQNSGEVPGVKLRQNPVEQGGTKDNREANAAYERAADAGDTEAMIRVGWIYQNGRDVRQDYEKAKQYYRKAVDLGDAEALNYLGSLYENGLGVTRDYNQARSLYEKAADGGNANGLRNLGLLYALGRGVSQDYDRARSFFERAKLLYQEAADMGNAAAMTNLGWLYETGRGVGMDYYKAKSLYEKAALAGDAQAMNNLGQMYENARGTWRDYSKAKALYEQAAAAGNENARSHLEKLKE
jgi:TPR repeat protein